VGSPRYLLQSATAAARPAALNADNTACIQTPKLCSDFNKYGETIDTINGDDCTKLTPPRDQGDRCIFTTICEPHFNECRSVTDSAKCPLNIPQDSLYKCEYKSTCEKVIRDCFEGITPSKTYCPQLRISGLETDQERSKKACIYTGGICQEVLKKCDYYSDNQDTCNSKIPVNGDGNDYDYSKRCFYDETKEIKCQTLDRLCTDYSDICNDIPGILLNKEICEQLIVKDTNKRCVYKGGICQEEYKSCELYSSNEIEKTEGECEGIILSDSNKKCVYIPKEDKCEERPIYESCEQYTGKDKDICEKILSPTTHSFCILDKDSKCKERPTLCSEISDGNIEDCIYYAKASDSNKRCAYDDTPSSPTPTTPVHSPRCYEEYARCEDYKENDTTICEAIRLYNGNTCEFKSGRCRSKNKICSEAYTEEECKLINKTGVTDPDRMICDFIKYSTDSNHHCVENYKYCSDYRGTNSDICSKIKPYDESGNNLDKFFKCEIFNRNTGCEKVPKDCEDAESNAILCAELSPFIKDNTVKHCVFSREKCKTHFKKCEGVINFSSSTASKCTDNIIENYITNECEVDTYDPPKCIRKKRCTEFSPNSYAELCKSINPRCVYDPYNNYCNTNDLFCTSIKFYPESPGSEEICNSIDINEPYMICSLKEDKSGCEKKYRETFYPTVGSIEEENNTPSSSLFIKGINPIIILLCLFF